MNDTTTTFTPPSCACCDGDDGPSIHNAGSQWYCVVCWADSCCRDCGRDVDEPGTLDDPPICDRCSAAAAAEAMWREWIEGVQQALERVAGYQLRWAGSCASRSVYCDIGGLRIRVSDHCQGWGHAVHGAPDFSIVGPLDAIDTARAMARLMRLFVEAADD